MALDFSQLVGELKLNQLYGIIVPQRGCGFVQASPTATFLANSLTIVQA